MEDAHPTTTLIVALLKPKKTELKQKHRAM
jgi:hypothetical protein